jgi:hypothetical protein
VEGLSIGHDMGGGWVDEVHQSLIGLARNQAPEDKLAARIDDESKVVEVKNLA